MSDWQHPTESAASRVPPSYFITIANKAEQRWEQLEADEELAGPWRQLFSQVQSPRHVLSELLQNADDAGAKWVRARIVDNYFVFEHDGRDFDESDFASLCRFGYSNKRNLHTIGFRGIGFKSTFSLGDLVAVNTPSLAVWFTKDRFTQPFWNSSAPESRVTSVRVKIQDTHREAELRKNLDEWAASGASLLFFENIRELQVGDRTIKRETIEPGPVANSEWVRLTGTETRDLLVVRSEPENFPPEAVAEITKERFAEDFSLPPCRVDVVLGLAGEQRLYVVLPTDVRPDLPFSCNAPFVQDPARTGIKHPAMSPTNRWLLERVAELAAHTMVAWLENTGLSIEDRVHAYRFIPSQPHGTDTLSGAATDQVVIRFAEVCSEQPILVTTDQELAFPRATLAVNPRLHDVWTAQQIVDIFGEDKHVLLLSEHVCELHRRRLSQWRWLERVRDDEIVDRLANDNRFSSSELPPRPCSAESILTLWEYIQDVVDRDWNGKTRRRLMIVPVEGDRLLHAAEEVVRLGGRTAAVNAEDWQFLSQYVTVLDRGWVEYLADDSDDNPGTETQESEARRDTARSLLKAIGLDTASSADRVIGQAIGCLFGADGSVSHREAIRLTHIVAGLNAQVSPEFRYVTRDGRLRRAAEGLVFDPDGSLEDMLPQAWADTHLLDDVYARGSESCPESQWREWASSAKSGLGAFPLFANTMRDFSTREAFETLLKTRNIAPPEAYNYKTQLYEIIDYEFDTSLLTHWKTLATEDEQVWPRVAAALFEAGPNFWSKFCVAEAKEVTHGKKHRKPANCAPMPAAWVFRLATLPCLPDTYGKPRVPAELLMRTPDTDPLIGVESFVQPEFDNDASKPLLRLLGVRDSATGPDKVVDRIKALSAMEEPLLHEIAKWYETLDRIVARCKSDDLDTVRERFLNERLILTSENDWVSTTEVFRLPDEHELPGVPIVHPSVADISLWGRLGVAERPTADLLIGWLQELESGQKLDGASQKRVRGYLQRFPDRSWHDCGHWLSLDGCWTPVDRLDLALSRGVSVPLGSLFPQIKARTADLRMLRGEDGQQPPFSKIRDLGSAIEYRLTETDMFTMPPIHQPWLETFAEGLQRVKLPDEEQTSVVREAAAHLAETIWQPFKILRVTPYVDNTPAGEALDPNVIWHKNKLYVHDCPIETVFKAVVSEIARPFSHPAITEAINACAVRDAMFVVGYLANNFELEEPSAEVSESEAASENGDGLTGEASEPTASDRSDAATIDGSGDGDEPVDDALQPDEAQAGWSPDGGFEGDEETETCDLDDPDAWDENERDATKEGKDGAHKRKQPLIERFAEGNGFFWVAQQNRYVHREGASLRRAQPPFTWELYSVAGELENQYWVQDKSLERGTMEIGADLWELIQRNPRSCGMILVDAHDRPREWSGVELVKLASSGAIEVFPAKYRLRLESQQVDDDGGLGVDATSNGSVSNASSDIRTSDVPPTYVVPSTMDDREGGPVGDPSRKFVKPSAAELDFIFKNLTEAREPQDESPILRDKPKENDHAIVQPTEIANTSRESEPATEMADVSGHDEAQFSQAIEQLEAEVRSDFESGITTQLEADDRLARVDEHRALVCRFLHLQERFSAGTLDSIGDTAIWRLKGGLHMSESPRPFVFDLSVERFLEYSILDLFDRDQIGPQRVSEIVSAIENAVVTDITGGDLT